MQWKYSKSAPKKFKADKVMLTFVFDHDFMVSFLVEFKNMNKVHRVIKRTCLGMLSRGVVLLQDSARFHVANVVQENIQQKEWNILEHPSYSPDLS